MAGGVGHMGGLTNPRPWRGRCRAGYSNTGGPPLPQKRAPLTKKWVCMVDVKLRIVRIHFLSDPKNIKIRICQNMQILYKKWKMLESEGQKQKHLFFWNERTFLILFLSFPVFLIILIFRKIPVYNFFDHLVSDIIQNSLFCSYPIMCRSIFYYYQV